MSTPQAHSDAPEKEISFLRLIGTCISARILVDIGVQMFNPFLPIFAAGLKTDVVTLGRMLSLRSLMGLFAPLFGTMADRHGYRIVMRGALLVSAAGMWLIGLSTNIAMALIGLICIGLGLAAFVPTLQAYLSARLPYSRRARGMGMLEYSWAITGIVGLSLLGQLISFAGWRTPFYFLGTGMFVMFFVLATLPGAAEVRPVRQPSAARTLWQRIRDFFYVEENPVSTYATIAAAALSFFAAMQMMIIHGAWYAAEYSFNAQQLGFVALVFGLFDLTASVSVSLFTDRFGKWRSVVLGNAGALLGYLLIPFFNVGPIPAIISAGFARGFFEFAIVANFPLLSEQSPRQRAKIMTLSAAFSLSSATIANFTAPQIYVNYGIGGVTMLSAICATAALALLIFRVKEGIVVDSD